VVEARISRQSAEVAAEAPNAASATRLASEVAGLGNETVTNVEARVSRVSVEVVGKRSDAAAVTRLGSEVAGLPNTATAAVEARISRISAEVVINMSSEAAVTRLASEVAGTANEAVTAVQGRISRQSAEIAARRGSSGTVTPLALSDDSDLFLHDWADEGELSSSYSTDVVPSAETGAEARRGLVLKPSRSMSIAWREESTQLDAGGFSRLDRLYVRLRRLTDQRFQVPLYPDLRNLASTVTSGSTIVPFDTRYGRWFVGARVAIVRLSAGGTYYAHSYHTITDKSDAQLEITPAVAVDIPVGSQILPVMDCEVELEVEAEQVHGCLASVELTVREVAGASQLPPTKSDTPTNGQTFQGVPIFDVTPDWSRGVTSRRSRLGIEFRSGRDRGVSAYAARSRQGYEESFTEERPGFWRLVEFFDTRRGRLRSFWHVDHEYLWEAVQLDPSFVAIAQFGDIDDVKEELEGAHVGIVMSDGTYYVREVVTIQDVMTVRRLTVTPALPAGLVVDDVYRVARARRMRFDSDEMRETWSTAGLASTRLQMIETLEEKEVL
jgi:hypothetical protein